MGMYLDVVVVYGVAWDPGNAPWGVDAEGEPVETGEPVCDGKLVWGCHGHTAGDPDVHLAVCEAESLPGGSRFARLVVEVPEWQTDEWNELLWGYLKGQGIAEADLPNPGWLALASFG